MRILKYAAVAALGLAFGLYESTFLTFVSGWLSYLKPILPSLVFFMLLERRGYALIFGACAGTVLDLFAVESPSFAPWRLLFIAATLWLVSERILTNRSIYSMVTMTLAGRLFDWSWLVTTEWIYGLMGRDVYLAPSLADLGRTAALDLVVTVALFIFGLLVMRQYLRPRRALAYG